MKGCVSVNRVLNLKLKLETIGMMLCWCLFSSIVNILQISIIWVCDLHPYCNSCAIVFHESILDVDVRNHRYWFRQKSEIRREGT